VVIFFKNTLRKPFLRFDGKNIAKDLSQQQKKDTFDQSESF
jgi:hypothetical protein